MAVSIDDKTNIPLFVAIGAVPLIVIAVVWLTAIDAKASSGEERSLRNERTLVKQMDLLSDIRAQLGRIEGQLNRGRR